MGLLGRRRGTPDIRVRNASLNQKQTTKWHKMMSFHFKLKQRAWHIVAVHKMPPE